MKTTDNHNEPKLNIEGVSEQELKRNRFKTPEGYFENLTPRVMESVRSAEKPLSQPFDWGRILVPAFGITAVAVAIWFFLPPDENPTPDFDTVLASLTVEELTAYADVQPTELIKYNLVEYSDVELNEPLTEDELIEYFSTEDEIELNTLMNEIEI